jgi:L-threonylcarbamoyladenylate synthase
VTEVLRVDPGNPDRTVIARAAECLRNGGLVAFPTETVYGLGAHALDRSAIERVFAAKQRPASDPLIVHVASIDEAASLVTGIPDSARQLAARFWPGPLTMVLRRSAQVPDEVTAGLATVAVRVPSHPVARALIEAARVPIAAPSANLFSRPSPTRAAHVLADLDGRIDMIVDGGATHLGLESTVVDLSGAAATVLRPGAINIEALRQFLPGITTQRSLAHSDAAMPSPGMLAKHYSPRTPVVLHVGERAVALRALRRDAQQRLERGEPVVALSYTEDVKELRSLPVQIVELGSEADPAAVAARLYAALRESDELGATAILVRSITTAHPLSVAIHDRLRRAAVR